MKKLVSLFCFLLAAAALYAYDSPAPGGKITASFGEAAKGQFNTGIEIRTDDVFASVADTMRKEDKKGYLDLITKMIESSADDKDEVIICKKDKDIITQKEIDSISKAIGKKLTLSKEFGDFDGGVMLCGEKFDKNLTFALEFEQIKDEQEEKLAKILFGE